VTHTPTPGIRRLAGGLFAAVALVLASSASMAAATGFDNRMNALIEHVKADPNYKRIPLNSSADREWFYNESEQLYVGKITKEQFVADGTKQFPGYEASLATVADFMAQK